MTRYPDYRAAEHAAYELLLRYGQSLPVRPMTMLRDAAQVVAYEDAAEQLGLSSGAFERQYGGADAFTVRQGNRYLVCCRTDGNPARLNFTLAHELGHIALAHAGACEAEEREADHFASCLLCPEPVRQRMLTRPGLTAEDIAALCYISVPAAQAVMRRRTASADAALLEQIEALLGPQADTVVPGTGHFRHPLRNAE